MVSGIDNNNELVSKINLNDIFRSKIQEMVDIINQIRSEKKYTNPIDQDSLIDSITQILLYNNYCEGGEYDIDYVLETNDVIADEFFYLIIPEIYEQFSQMRFLRFYEIPANARNVENIDSDTFEDFKSELINLFISVWREEAAAAAAPAGASASEIKEEDSAMAPEEAAAAAASETKEEDSTMAPEEPAAAPASEIKEEDSTMAPEESAPALASETKEEDSTIMEDPSIEPTVQQAESPSYEPQTKRQRKQGGGRKRQTRKKNKIKKKNRKTLRKKHHNKKNNTRKSKRVKKITIKNKKRN